jgi:hypothetical protein
LSRERVRIRKAFAGLLLDRPDIEDLKRKPLGAKRGEISLKKELEPCEEPEILRLSPGTIRDCKLFCVNLEKGIRDESERRRMPAAY